METFIGLVNTTLDIYPVGSLEPLVSDNVAAMFRFINFGALSGIVAVFGICANIINIITFTKLGFQETINISLAALALADLIHLCGLLIHSICFAEILCSFFCDSVNFETLSYVIGAIPRYHFVTTAGCITTIVAFERCVCVFRPLKVKTIFTKTRNVTALIGAYVIVGLVFGPVYYNSRIDWVFYPETNTSKLTYFEAADGYKVSAVAYKLMSLVFVINYSIVVLCTVTIVSKLSMQSAWRAASQAQNSGQKIEVEGDNTEQQVINKKALTSKDKRATRTVVFVAGLYIICSFPGVIFIFTMSAVPAFNKGAAYTNLYDVLWSFPCITEGFCSSANILVYVKTSTRFKQAFWGLFTRKGS